MKIVRCRSRVSVDTRSRMPLVHMIRLYKCDDFLFNYVQCISLILILLSTFAIQIMTHKEKKCAILLPGKEKLKLWIPIRY